MWETYYVILCLFFLYQFLTTSFLHFWWDFFVSYMQFLFFFLLVVNKRFGFSNWSVNLTLVECYMFVKGNIRCVNHLGRNCYTIFFLLNLILEPSVVMVCKAEFTSDLIVDRDSGNFVNPYICASYMRVIDRPQHSEFANQEGMSSLGSRKNVM